MPVAPTAAPTDTAAPAAPAATATTVVSDQPAATQETTWLYRGIHTFWSPTRDGGTGMYMGELVFGGLLTMDEKTNPLPYAAESWTSSSDGLVWTFKIRNDLKFAPTGRPVKAIDIKKSFELIIPNMYDWEAPTYYFMVKGAQEAKKKAFDSGWKQIGDVAQPTDIAGFVAKSDYELEIHLTAPAPALIPFMSSGSLSGWAIGDPEQMAKDTATKRWNEDGGGALGPYMIKSYNEQTNDVTLVANPYFVLGKKPTLTQITLRNVKDPQTRLIGYQNNDGDFDWDIPTADAKQFADPANALHAQEHLRAAANFYWWGFNLDSEPFNDMNLRKAVALSIDYKKLHDALYGAIAATPTSIIPAGPYHRDDLFPKYYKLDTEGAMAAFKNSKYGGDPKKVPPITIFASSGDSDQQQFAQVIQQMVKDTLGISMSIMTKDSLAESEKPKVHLNPQSWGTATVDPSEWTYQITTPQHTVNFGFPPDKAKSDAWVNTVNTELNVDKRKATFAEAEEYVASQYMILPDKTTPFISLEKPWLRGLYTAPNWYWIRTNEIYVSQH
jgi:ABC-type oligopeptide transport system substrate-binding subunit